MGFVKRSGKVGGTLTHKTSLINGLSIAEQDPALNRPKTNKKGKENKKKVASSEALLKK